MNFCAPKYTAPMNFFPLKQYPKNSFSSKLPFEHTCFECEHTISEQSKDTNFCPFFSVFCILRMLSYRLQGASQSVPLCCVKREISLWHVCICTSVEHWASLAQQVKAWLYYNNYIYYDIDSTLLAMMYSTWIY